MNQYMPSDILSNILLRLPAASLQRMKYVNKQWFETISSPHFAESHRQSDEEFDLIYSAGDDSYFLQISKLNVQEKQNSRQDPRKIIPHSIQVYGSCKGLLLFGRGNVLYVTNPVSGKTLRLPPLGGDIRPPISASIGCDPCTGECKVAVVEFSLSMSAMSRVLTVQRQGSSGWREVDVPFNFAYFCGTPVFAQKGFHWLYSNIITTMDLGQEKIFQHAITSPSLLAKLIEWDGCLAGVPNYTHSFSYTVFVLRESESGPMWTELEVDIAFFKHLCPSEFFCEDYPPYPVASFRNGQVIIFKRRGDNKSFFAYHLVPGVMTQFTAEEPQGRRMYEDNGNGYYQEGSFMAHVDLMISCSANISSDDQISL